MKAALNLIVLFVFSLSLHAQTAKLNGRVIDMETHEPIVYTNIGLEGTFLGTASNASGEFELVIPDEFLSGRLYFSAVGYQNESAPVQELLNRGFITVRLKAQTYDIEGVDIEAQSMVLFRILRNASQNVPQNFPTSPLELGFYYLGIDETADDRQSTEAIIQLYDPSAYASPSILDAYNNRHYRFTQIRRNFEASSFREGHTGVDELLELDIARMRNHVLNPGLLPDFDLQMESESVVNGDSVWVIAYRTSRPDLPRSGEFHATELEGRISISKTNYAILQNQIRLKSDRQNLQGRSLAASSDNALSRVETLIEINYQKTGGLMLPAAIRIQKHFNDPHQQERKTDYQLVLLNAELQNPSPVNGRNYYPALETNSSFWETFTPPLTAIPF